MKLKVTGGARSCASWRPIAATFAICAVACGGHPDEAGPGAPSHPSVASSSAGMVVTGSPYATEAGIRLLEAGGNAVDAAVAAAFALTVAEPTQSGLGGRTQMLIRLADGSTWAVDGTTQVPAGYDAATAPRGEHGYAAVGIPGTVAALARAAREHGSLGLAAALEPARAWARGGILLPAGEAGRFAGVADELDPYSEAARVFLDDAGEALEPSALLVQPELAGVLEAVAGGGRDAFYRGEIAGLIAEDMAANGGFVTAEDLAAYEAVDGAVGRGRFGGLELVGSYLPASGITVIEVLQILDRLDLRQAGEVEWYATVAEALLAGFEDREIAEHWGRERAVAWLTSDSLAQRRAVEVAARVAAAGARRSELARGGRREAPMGAAGEPAFTTHLSVADTLGNVVALTQSLGPTLGARVVTPGLGFLYASTLGGYLAGGEPGYRPWSSQAPLVVLRDGRPVLVLGGAGARRILSALVTTIVRFAQGVDLETAMTLPRLHPTEGSLLVEEGWNGLDDLAALGYAVEERPRTYFARLNVVELLPDGSFRGVGEPRWMESAAGGPGR